MNQIFGKIHAISSLSTYTLTIATLKLTYKLTNCDTLCHN